MADDGGAPVRRRVLADLRPLRESPEFRRLWLGGSLSGMGGMMTSLVAVPVQIYGMTHSSFAVGMTGLAAAVPLIALGLFGGSIVDAFDRRALVLLTTAGEVLLSVLFVVQAAAGLHQLWLLYALVAAQSCLEAVNQPAGRTFMARLLPPSRYPAALALTSLSFQLALVGGPLLGGVLVGAGGLKLVYLVDAVSFGFALYAVARLPPMRPEGGRTGTPGLRSIVAGLRFLRTRSIVAAVLLVDLNYTIFGMPFALFPAFAEGFGGGARTVGLLSAAPALGGVLAATVSGRLSHVRRQGLGLLAAIVVSGVATVGFGLSPTVWLAVPMLAVAGGADMVNSVMRNTVIQTSTPDRFRGRISGIGFVVGAGGPRLGSVESGAVASLTSPVVSAAGGGVLAAVGAVVVALLLPALARYRAPAADPEPEVAPAG